MDNIQDHQAQGILNTIDMERSMEGRCTTSLFFISIKWLIGQGLVYLRLFEGAWTVMTFIVFVSLYYDRTIFYRMKNISRTSELPVRSYENRRFPL